MKEGTTRLKIIERHARKKNAAVATSRPALKHITRPVFSLTLCYAVSSSVFRALYSCIDTRLSAVAMKASSVFRPCLMESCSVNNVCIALPSASKSTRSRLAPDTVAIDDMATYFCFFSAGFRIWKEHSRLSSTLIIAPALSNSPQ